MPLFMVEAVDPNGKKVRKLFETDEDTLFIYLQFSNLTPIKVKTLPKVFKYLNIRKLGSRVKRAEIIEVLENLHLIVKSGLPLSTGILDLAEDAQNPALKDMLYDIALKIQGGMSLSNAVEQYKDIFTDVVISLFKIGEETGALDRTLRDAAEHLRRIEDLISKTKQALIYPVFALTAVFGALIFWTVYVMPKLVKMFEDMGIELPAVTRGFMQVAEFLKGYGMFILGFIVISFILIKIMKKKNEKVRLFFDRLNLKLPVIGVILKNFYYAFFSEYLRLMISAGLPLNRSLEIMGHNLRNFVFKKAILNVRSKIEEGFGLSVAIKEEGIFSPLVVRMISVGEQTGGLEEQLKYISDYYYYKVDYISQNIAKMIEPIVISIVGVFLMIIMVSLISPIFDLITKLST